MDREGFSKEVKKIEAAINKHNIKKLYTFIKQLPKTEIHIHAEAVLSEKTIFSLNQKYDISSKIKSIDDMKRFYEINSLSKMIDLFLYIQSCFREVKDLNLIARDVLAYMKRNNIYYIELFFSPTAFIKNGLEFENMMSVLEKAFDSTEEKTGRVIKIIIDVSRTFGVKNAVMNMEHTLKYIESHKKTTRIIGIGLGGSEMKGPAKDYKAVFAKAEKNGLKLVVHAGEEVGPDSIWRALLDLHAQRIGHGTSAIQDEKLLVYLKENKIPLEICPTSNVVTHKYVKRIEDHPVRKFFDKGIFVTINTDDPVLFRVELTDEYINLYKFMNFKISEIFQLIKNNLYASFLAAAKKKDYWENFKIEAVKIAEKVYKISEDNKSLVPAKKTIKSVIKS